MLPNSHDYFFNVRTESLPVYKHHDVYMLVKSPHTTKHRSQSCIIAI